MARETVTLQLRWRHNRRTVGDKVTADLDWREAPSLRRYLEDAIRQEKGAYWLRRIEEFLLEVRSGKKDRHLRDFVASRDDERRR